MTKMLPGKPHNGSTKSEKVVFRLIEEAEESQAYYCLHSLGIARHERKDYAESDFVVIGPEGVFCLEVKGGEVSRSEGVWEIGWPGKTYKSREGPFKQAQATRWPLKNEVINKLGTPIKYDVLFAWGVIFPDIIFKETDPEWDLELVYDQSFKEESFIKYIKRLYQYNISRKQKIGKKAYKKLSTSRVCEIVNCLRGDFEIVQSVGGLISDSKQELVRLSADQYRLLDMVLDPDNPRILCEGGAGTGKTLLALEAARRLSGSNKRILILCYNRLLERYLRRESASIGTDIEVRSIYRFLDSRIKKAGLSKQLLEIRKVCSKQQFFDEEYPRLFEEAALRLMEEDEFEIYNLVIIDEAQDILSTSLMNCVSDSIEGGLSEGNWIIFYDPGFQADVYSQMNEAVLRHLKSLRPVPFRLRINYRNPRNIVREMASLIKIEPPECARNIASKVEYLTFHTDADQGKKLRALLVELMREGIKPSDVTVLSFFTRERSCAGSNPPDIGKPIFFLDDADSKSFNEQSFSASSISAFKGLENEIIILTDVPDQKSMTDWERAALYVGMTRARTKLYVLVKPDFCEWKTSSLIDQTGEI